MDDDSLRRQQQQPVSCASAIAISLSRMAAVARACRKPSDALALRSDRLDPIRERLHELLQKFAVAVADELAMFIEKLVGMADIGLGLLHGRYVQKHQRLPEMMIGTEGPDRARRTTDDRTRLAVPDAASIRPGADIQRILESGRHRPVIFGGDEQNCIGGLDALAECDPWRGRSCGLQILIEKRQLPDLDGFELHRRWRERHQRIRQHPVERRLPQASNQHAHIHRHIHGHSPFRYFSSKRTRFARRLVLPASRVRAYAVAEDLMILVKLGLRFSKKAENASFASSEL